MSKSFKSEPPQISLTLASIEYIRVDCELIRQTALYIHNTLDDLRRYKINDGISIQRNRNVLFFSFSSVTVVVTVFVYKFGVNNI